MATKSLDLEKSLECPVCMDLFTNPKDLSCSHTFCEGCVQQIADGGSTVTCPECRQVTYLDEYSKDMGLKTNRVVVRLIETLKTTDGQSSGEGQDTCASHPPYLKKYYCKKCEILACSECIMEIHLPHASTDTCSAQIFLDQRKAEMRKMLEESEEILESQREIVKTLEKERDRGSGLTSASTSEYCLSIPTILNSLIHSKKEYDNKLNMELHSREHWMTTRVNVNQLGKDLVEKGNAEGIIATYPQWSEAMESLVQMESTQSGFAEAEKCCVNLLAHTCLSLLEKITTILKGNYMLQMYINKTCSYTLQMKVTVSYVHP